VPKSSGDLQGEGERGGRNERGMEGRERERERESGERLHHAPPPPSRWWRLVWSLVMCTLHTSTPCRRGLEQTERAVDFLFYLLVRLCSSCLPACPLTKTTRYCAHVNRTKITPVQSKRSRKRRRSSPWPPCGTRRRAPLSSRRGA